MAVVNYSNQLKELIKSYTFKRFVKNNKNLLLGTEYKHLEELQKYQPKVESVKREIENLLMEI